MPLIVRFLLWLVCTALTVTAVFLAVGFVMDSTAPMPPVAHAASTVFGDVSPSASPVIGAAASSATPSPFTSSSPASPSPSAPSTPVRTAQPPAPTHTTMSPSAVRSPTQPVCQSNAGTHTVHSQGGQVSFRFGTGAVCLVAASPSPGFTAQVTQSDPATLVVNFTGDSHRSVVTVTVSPQPQASVRESSR